MVRVAIFADDLTGACDTGVKLLAPGKSVEIVIDILADARICKTSAWTISVSTNTRSSQAKYAKEKVKKCLAAASELKPMFYYKKVDSVLRGNIGSEIDAFMDTLSAKFALVAPAYPQNGRYILGGKLLIRNADGQTVEADAIKAIATGSVRNYASISHGCIQSGPQAVLREIQSKMEQGFSVFLADTEMESDFDILTDVVRTVGSACIPVGSAGWVSHLWGYWNELASGENKAESIEHPAGKNIIFAVGSCHPVTLHQVKAMALSDDVSCFPLETVGLTLENMAERVLEIVRAIEHAKADGNLRKAILITSANIGQKVDREFQLDNVSSPLIMQALALAVRYTLQQVDANGLCLCGGDVADCVLIHLGIYALRPLMELEPGVVISSADSPAFSGLVATKSGGFGSEQVLSNIFRCMRDGIGTGV